MNFEDVRWQPGDLALSLNPNAWYATLITWGTRSRYSHVRLIVDRHGNTVEAFNNGVRRGKVRIGDVVMRPPLTKEQRQEIPRIAQSLIGTPYGWVDVIVLGLAQIGIRLPRLKKRLESYDHLFCSQLYDLVLFLAKFHIFADKRTPQNVSPGDLADASLRAGWKQVNPFVDRKTSAPEPPM